MTLETYIKSYIGTVYVAQATRTVTVLSFDSSKSHFFEFRIRSRHSHVFLS